MNYTIQIEDREYLHWTIKQHEEQAGEARTGPIGLPENFHPLQYKLFHDDNFTFNEDNTIRITLSPFREFGKIHQGVLIIADGKTYGRTENKKRLLYKCIPNNRNLPAFLVPFDIKLELSKHIINKYVLFKYVHWNDKHPLGELVETIGPVNKYDAFEKYQLHCRSLSTSISKYSNHFTPLKNSNHTAVNSSTKLPVTDLNEAPQRGADSNLHWYKCKFSETDETSLIHSITKKYEPEDRTDEYVFTIDNDNTTDYDDAMSISEDSNGTIKVSIYIANVIVWLQEMDGWSNYGNRVSTIYLPERKISMLPNVLSENLCSLVEKRERFAISMDYVIFNDGSHTVSFHNTKIIVKKNYRYEASNLLRNPRYQKLLDITKKINVNVKDSHELVAYWMVKMNLEVGSLLYSKKSGIFRYAKGSSNDLPEKAESINSETEMILYNFYNHICSEYCAFKEDVIYTHSVMMVENYVHFTSPIRRLVDLINQIYLWPLLNYTQTPGMIDFVKTWTCSQNISYINDTMKAIRKTQSVCELVHMCYNNSNVFQSYEGIVFDKNIKTEKPETIYEYTVYVKDIKYLAHIKSDKNIKLFSIVECRIFVFHDKITVQDKIVLQIINS